MSKIVLFSLAIFLIFSESSLAQSQSQEFQADELSFDFMSSDGSYWYNCNHVKAREQHDWIVSCQNYTFNLHLFLYQYIRPNESTYEFHYWADEVSILNQSHTQSIWLTIDKGAKAKKILAYLGFQNDASQLRLQVELKNSRAVKK